MPKVNTTHFNEIEHQSNESRCNKIYVVFCLIVYLENKRTTKKTNGYYEVIAFDILQNKVKMKTKMNVQSQKPDHIKLLDQNGSNIANLNSVAFRICLNIYMYFMAVFGFVMQRKFYAYKCMKETVHHICLPLAMQSKTKTM